MAVLVANNVETTLGLPVGLLDTQITLASVPANFPPIGGGDTTYLVLEKGTRNSPSSLEVVLATDITGNVVDVTRGQDNTIPATFSPGDRVCLRFINKLYADLAATVATAQADATQALADAAAAQADATQAISDAGAAQADADTLAGIDYLTTSANGAVPSARVLSANAGLQLSGGSLSLDSTAVVGLGLIKPNIELPVGLLVSSVAAALAPTSQTAYAMYMGKADKAYTSVNVAWRQALAASGVTWAEIAVATGTHTLGSSSVLTTKGWTSIAGSVTSANTNFVTTISVSGISVLDDLWIIFGINATGTGTWRSGNMLSSGPGGTGGTIGSGFQQTATSTRPQSVSGTGFTIYMGVATPWIGATFV